MTTIIRDRNGTLVGTMYHHQHGADLRDRNGTLVGTYSATANETRDRTGTFIGNGNLLMTLL